MYNYRLFKCNGEHEFAILLLLYRYGYLEILLYSRLPSYRTDGIHNKSPSERVLGHSGHDVKWTIRAGFSADLWDLLIAVRYSPIVTQGTCTSLWFCKSHVIRVLSTSAHRGFLLIRYRSDPLTTNLPFYNESDPPRCNTACVNAFTRA